MEKKPVEFPPFYFDTRTEKYWLRVGEGRYLNLAGASVKGHLQMFGVDVDGYHKDMRIGERMLIESQIKRFVDYAGPLAGHNSGILVTDAGKRMLVTEDVKLPPPGKRPQAPGIEKFLEQLLGGDQTTHFLYWLKLARRSLARRDFSPGQMLCLFGPSGCGKSFFHVLVTQCLGGRLAKPFQYMSGKTTFNADLCANEHHIIEDESSSFSLTARREFGNAIKDAVVNPLVRLHGKGKEGIVVKVYKRITLSANDETENMMILPPLDDSILDKIMLFKCGRAELSKDFLKNMQMLTREGPGFLCYIDGLNVPPAYQCPFGRFGVKSYHHPAILEALGDVSPEERLNSLIDEVVFGIVNSEDVVEYRAEELERDLRNSPFSFSVERLMTFPNACGTYLSRLAKKFPHRFSSRKRHGRAVWTIKKEKSNDQ